MVRDSNGGSILFILDHLINTAETVPCHNKLYMTFEAAEMALHWCIFYEDVEVSDSRTAFDLSFLVHGSFQWGLFFMVFVFWCLMFLILMNWELFVWPSRKCCWGARLLLRVQPQGWFQAQWNDCRSERHSDEVSSEAVNPNPAVFGENNYLDHNYFKSIDATVKYHQISWIMLYTCMILYVIHVHLPQVFRFTFYLILLFLFSFLLKDL